MAPALPTTELPARTPAVVADRGDAGLPDSETDRAPDRARHPATAAASAPPGAYSGARTEPPAQARGAERRRPGRVATTNPELIALFRGQGAGPQAASPPGSFLPISSIALAFWALLFIVFT